MKFHKLHILFLVTVLFFTGCRTMQLNQDANVLGRGVKETSVGGGVSLGGDLVNGASMFGGFGLNLEIQQRFGIDDRIEFQFRGHSDFTLGGTTKAGFLFYSANVFNVALKVDLLQIQTHGFAFMPFIGLTYVMNNTNTKGIRYDQNLNMNFAFDPNIGFALIGSKDYYTRGVYFGGLFNISPNIAGIASGLASKSTFDMDFSFNVGWEKYAYKVIYRNEFSVFMGFTFNFLDYTTYVLNEYSNKTVPSSELRIYPNLLVYEFGISYHFSAAFRR